MVNGRIATICGLEGPLVFYKYEDRSSRGRSRVSCTQLGRDQLRVTARYAALPFVTLSSLFPIFHRFYLQRSLGSSRICCGPHVDTALQPCPMSRCPIKASGPGALPASPFFAAIDASGRCACFAPQVCDA